MHWNVFTIFVDSIEKINQINSDLIFAFQLHAIQWSVQAIECNNIETTSQLYKLKAVIKANKVEFSGNLEPTFIQKIWQTIRVSWANGYLNSTSSC